MKNKINAGLLALFLGAFGIHRFYLGQNFLGILYLVFCWTLVPIVLALIDACVFFIQSDKAFDIKYNHGSYCSNVHKARLSIQEVYRYQPERNELANGRSAAKGSKKSRWYYSHTLS